MKLDSLHRSADPGLTTARSIVEKTSGFILQKTAVWHDLCLKIGCPCRKHHRLEMAFQPARTLLSLFPVCLGISLCLSVSVSLCLHCVCLYLSVCLFLSPSVSLSVYFSLFLCLSVSLSLCVCVCVSCCLSSCVCVSALCLSASVSVSLSVSPTLGLTLPGSCSPPALNPSLKLFRGARNTSWRPGRSDGRAEQSLLTLFSVKSLPWVAKWLTMEAFQCLPA